MLEGVGSNIRHVLIIICCIVLSITASCASVPSADRTTSDIDSIDSPAMPLSPADMTGSAVISTEQKAAQMPAGDPSPGIPAGEAVSEQKDKSIIEESLQNSISERNMFPSTASAELIPAAAPSQGTAPGIQPETFSSLQDSYEGISDPIPVLDLSSRAAELTIVELFARLKTAEDRPTVPPTSPSAASAVEPSFELSELALSSVSPDEQIFHETSSDPLPEPYRREMIVSSSRNGKEMNATEAYDYDSTPVLLESLTGVEQPGKDEAPDIQMETIVVPQEAAEVVKTVQSVEEADERTDALAVPEASVSGSQNSAIAQSPAEEVIPVADLSPVGETRDLEGQGETSYESVAKADDAPSIAAPPHHEEETQMPSVENLQQASAEAEQSLFTAKHLEGLPGKAGALTGSTDSFGGNFFSSFLPGTHIEFIVRVMLLTILLLLSLALIWCVGKLITGGNRF